MEEVEDKRKEVHRMLVGSYCDEPFVKMTLKVFKEGEPVKITIKPEELERLVPPDLLSQHRKKYDPGRAERAEAVELAPIIVATFAGEHYVEIREGSMFGCTCPDFEMRLKGKHPCKHLLSLVKQVGERLVRWDEVLSTMEGDENGMRESEV